MPWTNDQMWALINKPEPEEIVRYDLINKPEPEELKHFGILGMKWGIRRFQNKDGSLTNAGKQRYDNSDSVDNDRITGDQVKELMKKKGVSYDDIYKEMGVDESSEDPDDYRDAETKWYRTQQEIDKINRTGKMDQRTSNEMINKEIDYSRDFEDTDEYKKLDKDFSKAYDDYFSSNDSNMELMEKFYESERNLLSKTAEFTFSKMIKEYGPVMVSLWMTHGKDGSIKGDELKNKYIDEYVYVHAT